MTAELKEFFELLKQYEQNKFVTNTDYINLCNDLIKIIENKK